MLWKPTTQARSGVGTPTYQLHYNTYKIYILAKKEKANSMEVKNCR
jgi:hypothetical protein